MGDMTTRAAGPGGQGGGRYILAHTGAEIDTAVEGWQTARNRTDATAADIAEGKKGDCPIRACDGNDAGGK